MSDEERSLLLEENSFCVLEVECIHQNRLPPTVVSLISPTPSHPCPFLSALSQPTTIAKLVCQKSSIPLGVPDFRIYTAVTPVACEWPYQDSFVHQDI